MKLRHLNIVPGILGIWLLAHSETYAQPKEDDGVEVLARGPVHEAYADPTETNPVPSPVVPKAPPAPIEELPPDQKPEGENVQWIMGYWGYDDERKDYIWVSGFWRVPPPNHVWVPGEWRKIGEGYQYVPGFWNSLARQPVQGQLQQGQPVEAPELEYLPPPPPSLEAGPPVPAPTVTSVYVPGVWIYRERYVWRPGYWIDHRPGWVWIPASYRWTPAGYIFVNGYWDYPLAGRGLLFAPVYVPPAVLIQPRYVYTPTIIVREPCLFGALFVRRGYSHYYFGDYFGPRYVETGFTAWCGGGVSVGVTVRRGFYDPLFSYYSVSNRHDPFWNGGISELYVGRQRGIIAPPPRTLVQQNTVISNITVNNITNNNITNNNVTNNNSVNRVAMLSTLKQAQQANEVKLAPVTPQAVKQQVQAAQQLQAVAQQRAVQETRLAAQAPQTGGATAPPSVRRAPALNLPKEAVAQSQAAAHKAPPVPAPATLREVPKFVPATPLVHPNSEPVHPTAPAAPPVQPKLNTAPPLAPPVQPKLNTAPPLAPPVQPKFNPTPTIVPKAEMVMPKVNQTTPSVVPNLHVPSALPSVSPPVAPPVNHTVPPMNHLVQPVAPMNHPAPTINHPVVPAMQPKPQPHPSNNPPPKGNQQPTAQMHSAPQIHVSGYTPQAHSSPALHSASSVHAAPSRTQSVAHAKAPSPKKH